MLSITTPFAARSGAVLGAMLIAAALFSGCSKSEAPPQGGPGGPGGAMPPMPVTVLEVQPTTQPTVVEVMAQTEGAREAEVRARVGGILVKRLYQEGAPVKAGQVLFQIDRAPYEIALSQARASLAEVRAKADQTAREAARLKGLAEQNAISRKEADDAASNHAVALASIQAAEAAVHQAELNLSYTAVTAPLAGISGRAAKSEGNLIAAGGDLLTTVYQANPMWVRFSLGESDIARLPGGKLNPKTISGVELQLADGAAYPHKGRLNFLAGNLDLNLGTQQLRAEFDNPDNTLLPGQFVRARLLSGKREGVFVVPQTAVIQMEQGFMVMLVDADNKVAPRPIQPGEWQGSDWVILGGLKAGDKVILDNLMKLRPGATVNPHPPGAPGGAPGK